MLVIDPQSGSVQAWINQGAHPTVKPRGWVWNPIGVISPGRGDAEGVHFADVTVCIAPFVSYVKLEARGPADG